MELVGGSAGSEENSSIPSAKIRKEGRDGRCSTGQRHHRPARPPDKVAHPGDSPTSRAGTDVPRKLDGTQQTQKDTPSPLCLRRSNRVNGGGPLGGGHGLSKGLKAKAGSPGQAGLRGALVL